MVDQPTTDRFSSLFLETYKNSRLLEPAVTVKADIPGASIRLEKIVPRMAQAHTLGRPIDTGHHSIDVTLRLSGPPASEYSEIFSRVSSSDDDMRELATDQAKVFAHRGDQLILDALDHAEIISEVGAHNADITFETFAMVMQTLIGNGADPCRNRICVVCPHHWSEKMQNEKRMTLADDAKEQDASKGIISSVDDMRLVVLPKQPAAEKFRVADGVGYAFSDESIVLGYGCPPNLDFGEIHPELLRLISKYMRAGAAVRREKSCVKILGPKEPKEREKSHETT